MKKWISVNIYDLVDYVDWQVIYVTSEIEKPLVATIGMRIRNDSNLDQIIWNSEFKMIPSVITFISAHLSCATVGLVKD